MKNKERKLQKNYVVYVISQDGKPLMPTKRFWKVRKWLKEGKAKVINKNPKQFTIKLNFKTETEETQELDLGVDTGSKYIGTAVYNPQKQEIVYCSQIQLRDDIKDRMDERRKYRRARRNKLRYRKVRFLNRHNSIKQDRLNPTITSKLNSHIREIKNIISILPIFKIILETGNFDIALMKNPNMNRHWGYQQGPNYGFANTHEYVLYRDNHTCQLCKGKHKDSRLHIHHIIPKHNNGSNEESNLITLCKTCHDRIHAEERKTGICPTYGLQGKVKGQLKYATQMNIIRNRLLKQYSDAIETFGYITKQNRQKLNISKDHYLDACVIASGGNEIKQITKENKKKVVGFENRSNAIFRKVPILVDKGKINGFRRYDKVKYNNKQYFIYGRSHTGPFVITDIFGNKPKIEGKKTLGSISPKYLTKISSRRSVLVA